MVNEEQGHQRHRISRAIMQLKGIHLGRAECELPACPYRYIDIYTVYIDR